MNNRKSWYWCDAGKHWEFCWNTVRIGKQAMCDKCFLDWSDSDRHAQEAKTATHYLERDYAAQMI